MGLFSPYIYKKKSGEKWWLHIKEKGKVKFYFFSKEPLDALPAVPRGYEPFLNERTGLPMLRKKEKKKAK